MKSRKMATYKQIQEYVKQNYGYSCKSCWIAHMKEVCGLNPKRQNPGQRTNPCPEHRQQNLVEVFKHFNLI